MGAAVGFQTDQGPNTRLFWEHRNFFGAGERFRAQLDVSLVDQSLSVSLDKPDFLAQRQNLVTEVTLRNQDLEAYKATSLGAGTALEREFTDNLTGSLGIAFRYASIEDNQQPQGGVRAALAAGLDRLGFLERPVQPDPRRHAPAHAARPSSTCSTRRAGSSRRG